MEKKRYVQLRTQLRRDQKQPKDIVTVAYYGYGIYSWQVTKQVKDLPYDLLVSRVFETKDVEGNDCYLVDGAL